MTNYKRDERMPLIEQVREIPLPEVGPELQRLTHELRSLRLLYHDALAELEIWQRRPESAQKCDTCGGDGCTMPGTLPPACEDCAGTGFRWEGF